MSETTVVTETEPHRFAATPDTLAQSVVILVTLTVIQRAVGFGRSLLLCRWLPPEELGHWDLTLGFLELAAPIAVLSLPALFSRYVAYYQERRQLRMYLERSVVGIFGLTGLAIAWLYLGRSWFSHALFGNDEGTAMVWVLMAILPPLILFNTFIELFTGFRMNRAVGVLQFLQGLMFAGVALALAGAWLAKATSVAMAYGAACAACNVLAFYWLVRIWPTIPRDTIIVPHTRFWTKLLPVAAAVWLTNLLANLFAMSSRYMILHYSGLEPTEALAVVGQYHSARIIPLLIVSLSAMLSTMVVPFLSSDWEAGQRRDVALRVGLFLKVVGLGLTAGAAIVLLISPLLFQGILAGKFAAGQAILPWTLVCAVWFSMFWFAETYLWCDERVWLASLAFVGGLAANIGATLLLLPRWGLHGAALAASLGHLVLLLMMYGLASRRGMRIDMGTWIATASPLALALGPWYALTLLAALGSMGWSGTLLLAPEEKRQLASIVSGSADRVRVWRDRLSL